MAARFSQGLLRPASAAAAVAMLLAGVGCAGGGSERGPMKSRYVSGNLPSGVMGQLVEGTLARQNGDDDIALALLESAIREEEALILPNKVVGEIYRERGDLSRAEVFFTRLLRRDPETPLNHFLLAEVYELSGRIEAAIGAYLSGLELEPDSFAGNFGLGRSYVAADRPSEAIAPLRKATETDPQSGDAWLSLGLAHDASDDPTAAEAAYRQAEERIDRRTPKFASLLIAMAFNRSRQDRPQEAVPLLREAAAIDNSADTKRMLADAHAAAGEAARRAGDRRTADVQLQLAVDTYDDLLDAGETDTALLNAKAAALLRLWQIGGQLDSGLRDRAIEAWQQSLDLDPDQPRVEDAIRRFGEAGILD